MEAILFCIILYYAVKSAHERTKAALKSSRKAYAKRAAKSHPGMTSRQQVRSALRHDAGFAAAQLRHGFPSARHGFAQGWHEARTAHTQAHAAREKAKTEHAESLAERIAEIREYRRRQAEAAENIRRQYAEEHPEGSGEGTPEGSTSPAPEKVIPGTAEDVPPETDPPPNLCWSCFVRDGEEHAAWCATRKPVWPDDTAGPTYSWGLEGAPRHWPAANREQAERQAQSNSRDGRTHVVLEYPPGGGPGVPVVAYRNDDAVTADGGERDDYDDEAEAIRHSFEFEYCESCGKDLDRHRIGPDALGHAHAYCLDAEEDDEPAPDAYTSGPAEDGYGTTGNPPPDCWLCGLPVAGDELGGSAHQRCAEVNDRDIERTEVADERDLESVESDLFAQGKCSEPTAYGHGGSPRYCGRDVSRDGASLCPQHEAEAMGEYDRAAEDIHRHTRELLANEPASTPTTGGTQMSDTTYGSVATDMTSEVASAENRAAEVNAARVTAEAQSQEAAEAKARALRISEDMQALDMDPATLGAIADHIDAADAADKAHQEAEEALGRAHAATLRVTETAQNVQATMAQGHAGLAAAHQEAPVQAADKSFYGD